MEQLVGRETELQAITDALATEPPVAIVLEGEAGIGKTALWRAGIAEAENRGMRVVVARPVEAETGLSHTALADLLTPIVEDLTDDVPALQRRALDIALLRTGGDAGPVNPRAVGAATLTALRAAAAATPLVLAIDDIQWLDPASAAAVRFAVRRVTEDDRMVFLATRRTEPGALPLDVGFAEEQLARVAIGPLDPGALQRMLEARLAVKVPRPVVARLADISGGNPYFALELARAALSHSGDEALTAELPLPDSIFTVLRERLRALPHDTAEALGTVAAMGHPTIAAASEALDPGVLDPAFAADVLHEEGDKVRFDHPLLAETAYRMLPPARRRSVHLLLADIARDAEERARHLAASSTAPDTRRAAEIEIGAEAAASRGARAAAAELLEASARVEPDPERAAHRRIEAVRHHMTAGDGRRATALARALVVDLPAGTLRSRALVALAEQEGNFEESTQLARQAVAEAEGDREALIAALLIEGVVLIIRDRLSEAHEALLRATELCRSDDPRPLRVQVLTNYADLVHVRGEPGAMDLQRQAAELEGDDLIPNAAWGPGAVLARSLMYADELDEARPLLEERHRRAVELGDDESRGSLSLFLAELEIRAGRLDPALRLTEEGIAIQAASYGEQAQGSLAWGRAMAAAYLGDVDLARDLAERALAQSEALSDGIFAAANSVALGFLDFSLGDNEAAVARFQPLIKRYLAGDAGEPGLRHNVFLPDAIEALVALERLDDADDLLLAWEDAGDRFDRQRIHATAARCRALLAAARGDVEHALGHAEAALEHHRDLPVPFERARTLIVVGTLHRRAKHKAAARAALEEAVEILDQMGARLWAERERAELGRIGGRAATDGLTPTERRVADLVAEGRSNKEVAGELFVSVRTVEANLTRVYAKLGIRSRTELAAIRQASDGRSRSPAQPPAPLS